MTGWDRDPLYGTPRPRRRTWTAVLGEFEAELDKAEALLRGDDPELAAADIALWTPPKDLGPLPEEHLEWAKLIQRRQRHVMDALRVAVSRKHQQRVYAAAVDPRPTSRPSMFIDSRT